MRIKDGCLGIGTVAPAYPLDVVVNGTVGPAIVANFRNSDTGAATSECRIVFSEGPSWYQAISGAYNSAAPYMGFSVNSTASTWAEKMRLTSAGRLGIGLTPNYTLDVAGDINTSGALRLTNSTFNISFIAPTLTASTAYTLPTADGSSGYVLKTNGSGTLSWQNLGGVSVTSITGTANQIVASASTGAVTLSFPATAGLSIGSYQSTTAPVGGIICPGNVSIGSSSIVAYPFNITSGSAGTIATLAGFNSPRSYAAANDGIQMNFLASNGTTGTHDYGAIIFGNNPASTNGGAAIADFRIGGSSSSSNHNRFLYASCTSGGFVDQVQICANVNVPIVYVNSSGYVGIGIAAPVTTLHVMGGIQVNPTANPTTIATANQIFVGEHSLNQAYRMQLGYLQETQWVGVIQSYDNDNPSYLLLNPSGGNVCVGITAPLSTFHVRSGQTAITDYGTATFDCLNSTHSSGITFGFDTGNNWSWMYSRTVGVAAIPLVVYGKLCVGSNSTINVTPSAGLTVMSPTGGSSSNWYDPANYAGFIMNNANAAQRYGLLVTDYWRDPENFVFCVDGRLAGIFPAPDTHSPYFIVSGLGLIGIGTASPDINLRVSGVSAQLGTKDGSVDNRLASISASSVGIIGTYSNHDLVVYTNGSERIRVKAAGNVGIGTASPVGLPTFCFFPIISS